MQFKVFSKLLPISKRPLLLMKELNLEDKKNDSDFSLEFPKPLQKQCPGFNEDSLLPKSCPSQNEQVCSGE